MPGSRRRVWRIRHLLVVPFLLFAPVLEVLDGDVEDVPLGAAPTAAASSAKHVRLATVPGDLVPPVWERPLPHTPLLPPPPWQPPTASPARFRPARRASAVRAADAATDPA